jgi:hypothetical protein
MRLAIKMDRRLRELLTKTKDPQSQNQRQIFSQAVSFPSQSMGADIREQRLIRKDSVVEHEDGKSRRKITDSGV